jgi:hypothetical protein
MTFKLSELNRWLVAVAALAVIGAQTMPAAAVNKKVERACRADFKRLCPSYNPESSSARACMESKSNEISSICMNALIDAGEVDRRRARRT